MFSLFKSHLDLSAFSLTTILFIDTTFADKITISKVLLFKYKWLLCNSYAHITSCRE